MPLVGEGYRIHVTGLTHDVRGYPVTSAEVHDVLVRRLNDKIRLNADKIMEWESYLLDDADVCVVTFGSSAIHSPCGQHVARAQGRRSACSAS